MRAELDAARIYDVIIADRSIADTIAYTAADGFHDIARAQLALARHHNPIYQEIRFRAAADFSYLRPDGVRHLDPALQAEVQTRMLEIYAALGMKITRCEA